MNAVAHTIPEGSFCLFVNWRSIPFWLVWWFTENFVEDIYFWFWWLCAFRAWNSWAAVLRCVSLNTCRKWEILVVLPTKMFPGWEKHIAQILIRVIWVIWKIMRKCQPVCKPPVSLLKDLARLYFIDSNEEHHFL